YHLSYGALAHLRLFPARRSSDLTAGGHHAAAATGSAGRNRHHRTAAGVTGENPAGRRRSKPVARAAAPDRTDDRAATATHRPSRSEEHTSELQSRENLVCRLLLE